MNIRKELEKINQKYFIGLMPDEATNDILALIGEWSGEKCLCNCHRGRLGKEFTLKFKYCPKCMDIHMFNEIRTRMELSLKEEK